MGKRYPTRKDGEWFPISIRRGHKIMCCDCGLVHFFRVRVKHSGRGHDVELSATRLERSTAAARRKLQYVRVRT